MLEVLSAGIDVTSPKPPAPMPLLVLPLISPLKLLRLLCVSGVAPFGESGKDDSSDSAPDSDAEFSSWKENIKKECCKPC